MAKTNRTWLYFNYDDLVELYNNGKKVLVSPKLTTDTHLPTGEIPQGFLKVRVLFNRRVSLCFAVPKSDALKFHREYKNKYNNYLYHEDTKRYEHRAKPSLSKTSDDLLSDLLQKK